MVVDHPCIRATPPLLIAAAGADRPDAWAVPVPVQLCDPYIVVHTYGMKDVSSASRSTGETDPSPP